ncbi:MAG: glycosyltransferase family 2 protein [Chloroflexota bacterium]
MSRSSVLGSPITVLLPVYNAGPALRRAIDSILAQSLPYFEFLIIDDCSTDGSRDLIESRARDDPRLRPVLHERNMGLTATLNQGLQIASGHLVARMDQDDEALPDRLACQLEFMQLHLDVLVAGSAVFHMGARPKFDRLVTPPTAANELREALQRYNCMYHPSVIMRRDAIVQMGGYRSEFKNAEDYDLWLRVSRRGGIVNMPTPLLRYRFTTSGMTLGRKWEQLSFVYLAQAAHAHGSQITDEVRQVANRMLAETDRAYFFREVAKGTVAELNALRMWGNAVTLTLQLSNEIGRREALRLLRLIAASYVRATASH